LDKLPATTVCERVCVRAGGCDLGGGSGDDVPIIYTTVPYTHTHHSHTLMYNIYNIHTCSMCENNNI